MFNTNAPSFDSNSIESISFEAAFAELEQIIGRLDSGDLTLDESVTLYERGRALSEHCQTLLDSAELRVRRLNENGEIESS